MNEPKFGNKKFFCGNLHIHASIWSYIHSAALNEGFLRLSEGGTCGTTTTTTRTGAAVDIGCNDKVRVFEEVLKLLLN